MHIMTMSGNPIGSRDVRFHIFVRWRLFFWKPRLSVSRRMVAVFLLAFFGATEAFALNEHSELPLVPDRALSLDTDEGSWISVDVSPDGILIFF